MAVMEPKHLPHRRFNPLTGEWVLVSPHRTLRPWQGRVEPLPSDQRPPYDPGCYLCPGNTRAGAAHNPAYQNTFVFDNDFAALLPEADGYPGESSPLFLSEAEPGRCRVICFSPRHDLSLPELSVTEITHVIRAWTDQTRGLLEEPGITHVQLFENKGELMGCSNPHPHSQIWATRHLPNEVEKELEHQRTYRERHGSSLLLNYLAEEQKRRERVVCANEHFTALVPYWAVWPFETMVLPHRTAGRLTDLNDTEIHGLADILKRLTTRYDNLFQCSFPYSMGFHQAPKLEGSEDFQLHLHFYPPLLRGATVRKFMVGFEMLGMPQRDLSSEQAAERLRQLSEIHYKQSGKRCQST
jgi:UDPglucose--hexose-1-phosphate uridylyltransferase